MATLIPFYITFRAIGLLDTPWALILVNTTFVLPFVVVIMRQTFLDLPVELEEAALVDGASYFGCLPAHRPAAGGAGGGRDRHDHLRLHLERVPVRSSLGITQTKMMPAHMAGAVDTRGVQFWFMATRALIAMVPPVLLALIAQRYIVRGLTLGAVKG